MNGPAAPCWRRLSSRRPGSRCSPTSRWPTSAETLPWQNRNSHVSKEQVVIRLMEFSVAPPHDSSNSFGHPGYVGITDACVAHVNRISRPPKGGDCHDEPLGSIHTVVPGLRQCPVAQTPSCLRGILDHLGTSIVDSHRFDTRGSVSTYIWSQRPCPHLHNYCMGIDQFAGNTMRLAGLHTTLP